MGQTAREEILRKLRAAPRKDVPSRPAVPPLNELSLNPEQLIESQDDSGLHGHGASISAHMLKLAEEADVSKREAAAIIDDVQAVVSRWPDHAAKAGVTKATAQHIAQSQPQID